MDVGRFLVEDIPGRERHRLAAFHLHFDGAFEHVYEYVRRMTMRLTDITGREFDQRHLALLPRQIGERLTHERCRLGTIRMCAVRFNRIRGHPHRDACRQAEDGESSHDFSFLSDEDASLYSHAALSRPRRRIASGDCPNTRTKLCRIRSGLVNPADRAMDFKASLPSSTFTRAASTLNRSIALAGVMPVAVANTRENCRTLRFATSANRSMGSDSVRCSRM